MRPTATSIDHPELLPTQEETKAPSPVPRVSFCRAVRVRRIPNASDFDDATTSSLYYSVDDHVAIKDRARSVTQNVAQKDRLDLTSNTYSRVVFRIFQECCKGSDFRISEQDKAALEHWVALGHCRRGLERWSIPPMDSERRARRSVSIRAIVEMQSKTLDDGSRISDHPELMARVYETLTIPAKRYARIMGEADAAATRKKETDFTMADRFVNKEAIICADANKRQYVKSCSRMVIRSAPAHGMRRAQSCRRLVSQSSSRGIRRAESLRFNNVS